MSRSSSQDSNGGDATQAVVDDKLVNKILDDVGTCWEDLGVELGLEWSAICNLDTEKKNCREKARGVICRWKQKEGTAAATVKRLADALLRMEKKAIAEKLLDSHRALQNEGQREGVQASSLRTRDGEGNHGIVNNIQIGDVNIGSISGSTFSITGNAHGRK